MAKMRYLLFFVLFVESLMRLEGAEDDNSRLNYFDTDLLRYAAEGRKGNVVVSPASVKSCLSMILEGAVGNTSAEIQRALRLSPDKVEFREQLFKYLSNLKTMTANTQLANVNVMFIAEKFNVKEEYAKRMRNVYFTDVLKMDFRNPVIAADAINSWVSNSTKGLITSIIEPVHINPSTDAFISNAVYFKSTWKYAFDSSQTHGACFRSRGNCKSVAMMELHADLPYAFVDNLQSHAVELPYNDDRYSMIVLVPLEQDGVDTLIRDLPYMSVPQIMKLLEPTEVDLSLPRFTVDYSEDIVGPLRQMRIKTLFTPDSDLSGLFEDGQAAQINSLYHEVQMSVDEVGTVAAAATSAIIVPLIGQGVQLVVDKPFVFFIRDNVGGFVLFGGKIEDPTLFVESMPQRGPMAIELMTSKVPKPVSEQITEKVPTSFVEEVTQKGPSSLRRQITQKGAAPPRGTVEDSVSDQFRFAFPT